MPQEWKLPQGWPEDLSLSGRGTTQNAGTATAEVLDKEPLDKESRVSRPMDGHLASKQEGTRQGLARRAIPHPRPPPCAQGQRLVILQVHKSQARPGAAIKM